MSLAPVLPPLLRWSSRGAIAGLALLWLSSCGSKTSSSACAPGRSIACSATAGCMGYQVCKSDGSGYEACRCDSDASPGSFPSAGPHSGLLGATCGADSDCRSGSTCLLPTSTVIEGEGPSAGLCVVDCTSSETICAGVDPDSTCVALNPASTDGTGRAAFCVPKCTLGNANANPDKCRGRVDLVCAEVTAHTGLGICRSACRSDLDCGERICDLRTGLCGDSRPAGDPIGSACDPAHPTCAGGCFQHSATYAECSGVCSFGSPGCGQTAGSGPPFDFYCDLDPAGLGGTGDLGYCAKVCDCNSDCGRSDAVCEPESLLSAQSGRKGVCGSTLYGSGEPRPNLPCHG